MAAQLPSHHRTPSSHHKKAAPPHARPARPTASHKRALSHRPPKSVQLESPSRTDDEEEAMAASFLQYCAFCEKQIIVPNNAILYCSESCRRKDNNKPVVSTPYTSENSPPHTPFANFTFDDLPVHNIVPQRSPTAPNIHRMSSTFSEASEDEHMYSGDESRMSKDTEAARYLRQFQSQDGSSTRTWRPRYNRSSTSTAAYSTAPSLSHTPTSTASASLPYTPSTRPLPLRQNPYNSYGSRSIDLVTPFTAAPTTAPSSLRDYSLKSVATAATSAGVVEAGLLYEKKSSLPPASLSQGSLKQLFRFNEMQAPPSHTEARRSPWS
ncbi:hypothetical protein H2201_002922 [Coniosporium apollinis]|uniref:Life-span regulatory factor domain-containing protein n=1 Tax=Coniosporium apollinis TaxID=61459 RepID=A0ABQ9P3Y4_9PEZI|nr:hypothetical protein H2201_002922 [Coniosporium apollinis]